MNSSDRIAVQRYAAAYNELSATNEQAQRRAEDLQAAAGALEAGWGNCWMNGWVLCVRK